MNRRLMAALAVILFATACAPLSRSAPPTAPETAEAPLLQPGRPVRNIILMIGDGMGVSHITAARTVQGRLNLDRFRTAGLIATHSFSHFITDSAAAGTALSTGFKTFNRGISVLPGGAPLKTLVAHAEEAKMATGIVVTSRVTHATPAAFYANAVSRRLEHAIAEQLLPSGLDVILGGGLALFLPRTDPRSAREDEKDLLAAFRSSHEVVTTPEAFAELATPRRLIGLFSRSHLPSSDDRTVSLNRMTAKALSILSAHPGGFFLMVEGSQIDWEGHDNDSDGVIRETLDFDRVVGTVLDFATKREDTLVLVTSDHETGGYAILKGSVVDRRITKTDFATESHTGQMVPMFSAGPRAALFGGIHDNTYVGKTLIALVKARKTETPSPARAGQ